MAKDKDAPLAKKSASETSTTETKTTSTPVLSLRNPLVIKGPDGKTEILPNLDPNHPALRNATLFAQLPNGTTVAVSLANVLGSSNPQQQQVMRALLSAGKLSIATAAQTHGVIGQRNTNPVVQKNTIPAVQKNTNPTTTAQSITPQSMPQHTVPKVVTQASKLVIQPPAPNINLPAVPKVVPLSAAVPKTVLKTEVSQSSSEAASSSDCNKEESSPNPSSTASQEIEGSNPQSDYFHYNSLDKLPPNVIHQLLKTQPQRLKDIKDVQSGDLSDPLQKPVKVIKEEAQSPVPSSVPTTVGMSPAKTPKYATNVTVKALLESRAAAATKTTEAPPAVPAPVPVPPNKSPKIQLLAKPNIAPRLPAAKPVQYVLTNTRNIAPRPQGVVVGSNVPRIVSPQSVQVMGSSSQNIRASIVPQQLQLTSPPHSVVQVVGAQPGMKLQGHAVQAGLVQVQGQTLQVQGQIVPSQGQIIQNQGQVVQSQCQVIQSQGQDAQSQIIQSPGQGQVIQGQIPQAKTLTHPTQETKPTVEVTKPQPLALSVVKQPAVSAVSQSASVADTSASNSTGTTLADSSLQSSQMQAAMALQQLSQCQASTAAPTSATLEDLQAGEALAQLATQVVPSSLPSSITSSASTVSSSSPVVASSTSSTSEELPKIAVSVIGTNTVHQVTVTISVTGKQL